MKKHIIIAAVFTAAGLVFQFALMGYGMLANCCFGLALVVLAYGGLGLLRKTHEKPAMALNKILTYGILLGLLALVVTEACLISETRAATGSGDTVIVLGAGVNGTQPSLTLRSRMDAAVKYAEENPNAVFVLSGGQGRGEDITEAECMRRYLTAKGVAEDRLLLEERSTSTLENVRFSRELLEAERPDFDGRVVLLTECYHVMRARLMALDNGYTDVSARASYTGYPVLTVNYYIREALALWYYMLTR